MKPWHFILATLNDHLGVWRDVPRGKPTRQGDREMMMNRKEAVLPPWEEDIDVWNEAYARWIANAIIRPIEVPRRGNCLIDTVKVKELLAKRKSSAVIAKIKVIRVER